MHDITVKSAADLAAYEGPHEIPGVRFRAAREALGVSSFGINVLELDPHNEGYPEHDHASDDHEEVYVVLRGSAVLRTPNGDRLIHQGQIVHVPGALKRKWITQDEPVTLLALGGTPGKAYAPSMGG